MRCRPAPGALLAHFTPFGDPYSWTLEGELFHEVATEANGNKAAPLNLIVRMTFVG
jgi:hypothetical protein